MRSLLYQTYEQVKTAKMQVPPNLQAYSYAPFRDGNSIIILTLEPGQGDDPLVGEPTEVSVDDFPSFTALSYVWGETTRSRQLVCDGKMLRITKSLDYALRGVRHATDPLRLWSDQACINQYDLWERSQQVQFIAKMYERAQLIHVWLGPDQLTQKFKFHVLDDMTHICLTCLRRVCYVLSNVRCTVTRKSHFLGRIWT
jgi:Heterokaryon incompatibility protein (HET)